MIHEASTNNAEPLLHCSGPRPIAEQSTEQNALFSAVPDFPPLPLLFLAALIEERDQVMKTLRERDERINLAAESANLALWAIDFERRESISTAVADGFDHGALNRGGAWRRAGGGECRGWGSGLLSLANGVKT